MWFLIICIESQMSLVIVRGDSAWQMHRIIVHDNACNRLIMYERACMVNMVYTVYLYTVYSIYQRKKGIGVVCTTPVSNCIQLIVFFFVESAPLRTHLREGRLCNSWFFGLVWQFDVFFGQQFGRVCMMSFGLFYQLLSKHFGGSTPRACVQLMLWIWVVSLCRRML